MPQAVILDVANDLESNIRIWLADHAEGGRFDVPLYITELTIPLMVATFGEEGWDVEFNYDETHDWLTFVKQNTKYLTYQDDFID